MRHWPVLVAAVVLAATSCASTPQAAPPAEVFEYEYEFTGDVGGTPVGGTFWFEEIDVSRLRFTVNSERGICTGEVRRMTSRVQLACGGLSFEFTRGGQVQQRAMATLAGTRTVTTRQCIRQERDNRGVLVCAEYANVEKDEPVTHRGTVEIRRRGAGG
ncbi:MAG TPA: hypothetical protein VK929_17515 [Longimicrobiales bacterium]|nr:hypothetical protein [Longimicrobiales bacterium]